MKKWDIVIKQDSKRQNVFGFFLVTGMGETRMVGMVECPMDGQINDSLAMCTDIRTAIMRRIRKSV